MEKQCLVSDITIPDLQQLDNPPLQPLCSAHVNCLPSHPAVEEVGWSLDSAIELSSYAVLSGLASGV